jgi:hypothetical protein
LLGAWATTADFGLPLDGGDACTASVMHNVPASLIADGLLAPPQASSPPVGCRTQPASTGSLAGTKMGYYNAKEKVPRLRSDGIADGWAGD